MYKDLSHLNHNQLNDLMNDYYNGKSNNKILKDYELSIPAATLYKFFPPKEFDEYKCEYCDTTLVANRKSKSNNIYYESDLYCPICNHLPFINNCQCENCQTKRKNDQIKKHKQIYDMYSQSQPSVDFEDLSFDNKIFLGALCKLQLSEDMTQIMPYSERLTSTQLTPSDKWTYDIYRTLFDENIITINPESSIEAFKNSDDFPSIYYMDRVIYNVNITNANSEIKKEIFSSILNPTYYNEDLSEQGYDLWKRIAIEECCEYLVYQLKKSNFEFSPGEKTYKIFDLILDSFSVSQIYGIIWRAVADASKSYLEGNISRKHAANMVIGSCERYAERAKLNGWKLTEYGRVKDLPQSELSSFFFNRVLEIGELGFTMKPTIV